MSRFSVWFVVSFVAGTMVASPTRAAEPERVRFDTADLVTIHGSYYASTKGKRAPCALLLHPVGETSQMEGWDDLAKMLQKNGIAVLTFDFRGHGDSTSVEKNFWLDPTNRTLKGYRPGKPKSQISFKDFTSARHYAMMLQDIAAAKHFLDSRNDAGECNSANLLVIGAESGAALGAAWIWTEWQRRRIQTSGPVVTATRFPLEGEDVTCAIWVGMTPMVGSARFPIDNWVRSPIREKVPMFFVHAQGDSKGTNYARHLYETVMRADRDKQLKYTIMRPIKDANQSGRALLNKSLDTIKDIESYVSTVLPERGSNPYVKRDADRTTPIRIAIERIF